MHLLLCQNILADIFLHSRLDEADIEREKGVVLEEIAMAEDTPEDAVHESQIMLAQYGDQPIARPILGSEETAARLRAIPFCAIITACTGPGDTARRWREITIGSR